jgi:hypothetical protein
VNLPAENLLSPDLLEAVDCWYWVDRNGILLDGRLFDLRNHLYQLDILQCDAPEQCFRKGAQIGLTSVQMLKTVHGMIKRRYPQGALYLFPTRDDVSDFSKGRFGPIIDDNPSIGAYVRDTNAANTKRIGAAMLYFRGTKSRSQLKSVPVDRLVFDEIDEMSPHMVDLALERVSHSSVKERIDISTPTLPDFGIDVRWQKSDQRVWQIQCKACRRHTCMEKEFEENGPNQRTLRRIGRGREKRVIRACIHCESEIHPRDGVWAAGYADRSHALVGWWISQLNSAYVEPAKILELFEDPRCNLTEFYNSKIGLPYVEATHRLSVEQVLALCGNHGMSERDPGACSMGVDQGNDLHVVIGKRDGCGARGKLVKIGVWREWEELDKLMRDYRVSRCVVDALPETRNARAFASRFPGRVYLNYYNAHQKGSYAWNDAEYTVQCNRTESLDASHNEITNGWMGLPRETPIVHEFAVQLHNVAKKLEEDEETGSKRFVYVKLGPDHYRHAFNYFCMALGVSTQGLMSGADLS